MFNETEVDENLKAVITLMISIDYFMKDLCLCFRLAGRLLQELRAVQQRHLDLDLELELELEGVLGGGVPTDLTELPH